MADQVVDGAQSEESPNSMSVEDVAVDLVALVANNQQSLLANSRSTHELRQMSDTHGQTLLQLSRSITCLADTVNSMKSSVELLGRNTNPGLSKQDTGTRDSGPITLSGSSAPVFLDGGPNARTSSSANPPLDLTVTGDDPSRDDDDQLSTDLDGERDQLTIDPLGDLSLDYEEQGAPKGPAVRMGMASNLKLAYDKKPPEDRIREWLEANPVPGNCGFLEVKRTNPDVFCSKKLPMAIRNKDKMLQSCQRLNAAAATTVIKSMEGLEHLAKSVPAVETAYKLLTNAIQMLGAGSQKTNQFRRDLIRPSFSDANRKLADEVPEDHPDLFGDLEERCKLLDSADTKRDLFGGKAPGRGKGKKRKTDDGKSDFRKSQSKDPAGVVQGNAAMGMSQIQQALTSMAQLPQQSLQSTGWQQPPSWMQGLTNPAQSWVNQTAQPMGQQFQNPYNGHQGYPNQRSTNSRGGNRRGRGRGPRRGK